MARSACLGIEHASSVLLEPTLELGDRDQDAPAASGDPQLRPHVFVEVVSADAQTGRRLVERKG
jgi:hypothetical protein